MPLCFEPDQEFPVVLAIDIDKPAESRPTFLAKSQTMRGHREILKTLDKLRETGVSVDEVFDANLNKLMHVLVGWRNMGGKEFSREALEDVLSYQESRELLELVAYNKHMGHEEKKA